MAAAEFAVAPAPGKLAQRLAHRTFPHYRPLLGRIGLDPRLIALCLLSGRDAVGLALGRVDGEVATLLSISVARAWQQRGGGSMLLREFERQAAARGGRRARLSGTTERGAALPAVVHLARSCGWTGPEPRGTAYVLDRERSLLAPWFTRARRRTGRMPIVPWRVMGERALGLIGPALWAADELHPRHHVGVGLDGAAHDLDASAVLRDGPEADAPVTGWVIVHALGPDEGRVSALAVRPDRQRGFAFGALVAHANRSLYDRGVRKASFVVHAHQDGMARFAERYLLPLANSARDSFECLKPLNVAARAAAVPPPPSPALRSPAAAGRPA